VPAVSRPALLIGVHAAPGSLAASRCDHACAPGPRPKIVRFRRGHHHPRRRARRRPDGAPGRRHDLDPIGESCERCAPSRLRDTCVPDSQNNRLLLESGTIRRDVNRAIMHPATPKLSVEDVGPIVSVAERARLARGARRYRVPRFRDAPARADRHVAASVIACCARRSTPRERPSSALTSMSSSTECRG